MGGGGGRAGSRFDENCEALTNNCRGRLQTAEGSDSNAGCMLEFFFFFFQCWAEAESDLNPMCIN